MSKFFFPLTKALFGTSPTREAIDQLETAIRSRAEAQQKQEQAEYDVATNALSIQHQNMKITRLEDDLRVAAAQGKLSRAEVALLKPLIGTLPHGDPIPGSRPLAGLGATGDGVPRALRPMSVSPVRPGTAQG